MTAQAPPISRQAVARSFSAAATTYDSHADLQRTVVDDLIKLIDKNPAAGTVLDLGSGTGYGSDQLALRFSEAKLVNLDLAEGMLDFHRSRKKSPENCFVCADAALLPFQAGVFDLVFSSLTLQWCAELNKVFQEIRRISKAGTQIVISTLGLGTLKEVGDLWLQVDDYRHVNTFLSMQEICHCAESAGLGIQEISSGRHQRHYPSLQALGAELKGLGAHNLNSGQAKGLTGRNKLMSLREAFESRKEHGLFTTGFEVLLLKLKVET